MNAEVQVEAVAKSRKPPVRNRLTIAEVDDLRDKYIAYIQGLFATIDALREQSRIGGLWRRYLIYPSLFVAGALFELAVGQPWWMP